MLWYIAVGSALGGVSRYLLGGLIQRLLDTTFPAGTLVVNVTGSFLLGTFLRYALDTPTLTPELRAFLTIGFCGGYTTFSTFSYESVALFEEGDWTRAAMYVTLSLVLSFLAMVLGFAAARGARLPAGRALSGQKGNGMSGVAGERTLMRIHIGERDRHDGRPLYEAIVRLLRERQFAGATVFRGIMGFGASAGIHTEKVLRLSLDLPIVVECVDTEERIQAILPELDRMIGGGLITLERARVILYRPETGRNPSAQAP